ncbi:MAG: DUF6371 domain-containing protein [Candidatus Paceibacterota bacterium]
MARFKNSLKMEYKYIFIPYKGVNSKTDCPQCGAKNSFSQYMDSETSEVLMGEYGRCDREEKCGYHYSPYENPPSNSSGVKIKIPPKKDYYNTLPKKYVDESLKNQFRDTLSLFLIQHFGKSGIDAIQVYKMGYSTIFGGGATIFWQIDSNNEVRSGKIFKYEENGKRKKTPYPHISWVHTYLKDDYELKQCFFGEHLLTEYPEKEVRVVESEKTAIIMYATSPEYVWLASTQLRGLSEDKLKVIKDKKTIFIPDKGKAYEIWKERINEFKNPLWRVSKFMENLSFEDDDDIADYILRKIITKSLVVPN